MGTGAGVVLSPGPRPSCSTYVCTRPPRGLERQVWLLQLQVRALTPAGHCPVFLPLVGDTEWGLKAQQVFNRRRSGRASELRANTAAGGSTEPTAHIMAFGLEERPGEVVGGPS